MNEEFDITLDTNSNDVDTIDIPKDASFKYDDYSDNIDDFKEDDDYSDNIDDFKEYDDYSDNIDEFKEDDDHSDNIDDFKEDDDYTDDVDTIDIPKDASFKYDDYSDNIDDFKEDDDYSDNIDDFKEDNDIDDFSDDDFFQGYEYKSVSDKIKIANSNNDILEWDGDEGNSVRVPIDKSGNLYNELQNYGVEGIEYKNGDVDFSPISKYDVEFLDEEKLYKDIGNSITMGDLINKNGDVKSRTNFNKFIRYKWQSGLKKQIIDRINSDEDFARDFSERTGIDVESATSINGFNEELKRNGLTLHETPDCQKIQFVPTKIHKAFKHSGGTSEMLERLINGDIHSKL